MAVEGEKTSKNPVYSEFCQRVHFQIEKTPNMRTGDVLINGRAICRGLGCSIATFPVELIVGKQDMKSGKEFIVSALENQIVQGCPLLNLPLRRRIRP